MSTTKKTFNGSNNSILLPVFGDLKNGDVFRLPNEQNINMITDDGDSYIDLTTGEMYDSVDPDQSIILVKSIEFNYSE